MTEAIMGVRSQLRSPSCVHLPCLGAAALQSRWRVISGLHAPLALAMHAALQQLPSRRMGSLVQVQFYAPAAAGGGVSLVMAYLNGNDVPDLLRGRTLIVKWLGTMCGVTAGLSLGPEAPMVHIGACVASLLAFLDFGGFLTIFI